MSRLMMVMAAAMVACGGPEVVFEISPHPPEGGFIQTTASRLDIVASLHNAVMPRIELRISAPVSISEARARMQAAGPGSGVTVRSQIMAAPLDTVVVTNQSEVRHALQSLGGPPGQGYWVEASATDGGEFVESTPRAVYWVADDVEPLDGW